MITDLDLPGEHDGRWLVEQLQMQWPSTAIVVLSDSMTADVPSITTLLVKPFTPTDLDVASAAALDQVHHLESHLILTQIAQGR